MFESIKNFFKKSAQKEDKQALKSKSAAKERLHLVLMQDRANVSADFLELMKQEIIEVIKKYIEVDEAAIDVRLTNQANDDGTNGAPALYANIPIMNIKNETRKIENISNKKEKNETKKEEKINSIVEDSPKDNDKEEKTNTKIKTKAKSKKEDAQTEKTEKEEIAQEQEKEEVESKK